MASLMAETTVCVTGASGFIGSWVVCSLLQRGYHVRGTVQNLGDERETKHLRSLEGADTQLELFEVELLDYESLATAIGKSQGVFHLASPCFLEPPKDPKKELLDPAVQGTLNVLKASHAAGVQKVVVTSSVSAMYPNPRLPPGTIIDENSWTDIDYCKEREAWYIISKTLAEQAVWKFVEDTGLNAVAINPGCVLGPLLPPRPNASAAVLLNILQGSSNPQELTWLGLVDVRDVARAQILLFESAAAKGRHLCTSRIDHFSDFTEELAQMYPQYNVYRFKEDTHPGIVRSANPAGKLVSLGFAFTDREKTIRDAVSSLESKGFLS